MLNHTQQAVTPIIYDTSYEVQEPNENETGAQLNGALKGISSTTFKHSGHATRSVHAKSHGLLSAEIEVLNDLPESLAQGMFAKPNTFPLVMRFSTIPGDMLDDKVSTPRGLAVKVVGVEGTRLEGSEGAMTQDFLFINGPDFSTSSGKKFLTGLKLLAETTDVAPRLKIILSKVLQATSKIIDGFGGNSDFLKGLGGHPETNILGETFYSQVPILYGNYMAKIAIVPACPALINVKNQPLDLKSYSDGIRKAVVDFFMNKTAVWELRVQLCTDIKKMPIEDASKHWPESLSPYITVAKITAKPQIAWSPHRSKMIDDGMRFSPWQGIAAHRPLGSIMRLRKRAYEMSAKFRSERNERHVAEPTDLTELG